MAYPAAIDTYSAVDGTSLVATEDHATMHNTVGSAIIQIETTLGTNSGTSVLKNATVGKFAVMNTGGTLDAGVLGTPMVRGGTIGTATIGSCIITGGTFTGGTITANTIGSATIIGGTIGTTTIQGGTINVPDLRGFYTTPGATTLAAAGIGTLDLNLSNEWRITFGTGNGTLVVANAIDGKKFIASLTQDAVGTRTITWFSTIKWAGSVAPTLTVTANKRDTFGFVCTSGSTYDGYIVGQDI